MTTVSASGLSEILVATDFTDTSDKALAYAKAIAKTFDSELLLVHVADPIAHIAVPEAAWADDSTRIQCEIEATQNAGEVLRAEGLKASALCEFGGIAQEVAQAAQQERAKLIVTGTNCRRGLNRLLFGSEAENILNASRIPVLIIGPKATVPPEGKITFRFMLGAVVLDKHGADIADFAKHFADEHGAKLQMVSFPAYEVAQEVDGYWAFKEELKRLEPASFAKSISPIVLSEPPVESLVELAIAREADLIIFDQRGSFLSPHLHRGLLSDVLATAPCPVLTLPKID